MYDEDIPYRSQPTSSAERTMQATADEINYDTLKNVQKHLQDSYDKVNGITLLDLKEKELPTKQQIYAHQMVLEILTPALDMVNDAVKAVDQNSK